MLSTLHINLAYQLYMEPASNVYVHYREQKRLNFFLSLFSQVSLDII
jgi:hypothetical protein